MGLQEKQQMNDVQEKRIPKFEEQIKKNGLIISLKVEWNSIPQNRAAISRCEMVLSEFGTRLWDFGQDKVAKDVISKAVKTVTLSHDASFTDPYAYKVELIGTDISFKANFEIFSLGASGGKQKNLKTAISDIL